MDWELVSIETIVSVLGFAERDGNTFKLTPKAWAELRRIFKGNDAYNLMGLEQSIVLHTNEALSRVNQTLCLALPAISKLNL